MALTSRKKPLSIEKLFFELLQISIGNSETLSVSPTKEQWAELFVLSNRQTLVAVAFQGVLRFRESCLKKTESGTSMDIDENLYLRWLGLTARVAQRNKHLSAACASLCKDLAHDGLYSCILKGQSNLLNYPATLREFRTPGDIDVWCGLMDPEGIDVAVIDSDGMGAHYVKYRGERGVIEWVLADYRARGEKIPEVNYHHVDWKYKGIDCEIHFRPSWMNNPWHNWRLHKWCKENEQWLIGDYCVSEFDDSFSVPSIEFNSVYQLIHIYRHLFNEGIGLRQLLDYYFVLKTLPTLAKQDTMRTLKIIGVDKFAGAVMYVLKEVFAMPEIFMICPINEVRGKFLLDEIMLAGNFGKYDARNVISSNEGYLRRFLRRQKRFLRFLTQYPSEVLWGPYFSIKQRLWRMWHGWK